MFGLAAADPISAMLSSDFLHARDFTFNGTAELLMIDYIPTLIYIVSECLLSLAHWSTAQVVYYHYTQRISFLESGCYLSKLDELLCLILLKALHAGQSGRGQPDTLEWTFVAIYFPAALPECTTR